jgi:NhaP-type Na+/H+ or K+/H+ antiporter
MILIFPFLVKTFLKSQHRSQVDALGISIGVFMGALAIGLATILVYIGFIRIKDRRAYARSKTIFLTAPYLGT